MRDEMRSQAIKKSASSDVTEKGRGVPQEATRKERKHVPVLLREAVAFLAPCSGGFYVDGTFGAGGYSTALLETADCHVIGIDRDLAALEQGAAIAGRFPGRLALIEGCFGNMATLLAMHNLTVVNGMALDLGVSSLQLDTPERGFSFQADGPLDMRMGHIGPTAADVVNTCSEAELTRILYELGEERMARRVARAIVVARPITRTTQLAAVVQRVVPHSHDGLDPATRTFQALRLFVNNEPDELERALVWSEQILAPGGRLVVVAFHSLEDRAVKRFFRVRTDHPPRVSRHRLETLCGRAPTFRVLTRRAVRPSAAETAANPRARSARLRAAERTAAPAWPDDLNR